MKISYESSLEEAVNSHIRLWELSKTARQWKRQGLILIPFLFLLVNWFLYDSFVEKTVFTILGCAVFIPLYLFFHRRILLKRIRKMLVEYLGSDQPVSCQYEFNDEGLVFRRQGTEVKFEWSAIQSVNLVESGIEILVKNNGGIAILPRRIFSEEEMQVWYDFAASAAGMNNRQVM